MSHARHLIIITLLSFIVQLFASHASFAGAMGSVDSMAMGLEGAKPSCHGTQVLDSDLGSSIDGCCDEGCFMMLCQGLYTLAMAPPPLHHNRIKGYVSPPQPNSLQGMYTPLYRPPAYS